MGSVVGFIRKYALPFAVSCLIIGGLSVVFGDGSAPTTGQLVMDAFLIGMSTHILSRAFGSSRFSRISQALNVYDEQCDPYGFIAAIQPYVQAFQPPYNEYAVWLLTPYGMALMDLGRDEEALRLVDQMRKSIDHAPSDHEKGSMMVNMEPLVERLFGASLALPLLGRAQELMDADPVPNDAGRRDYAKWETAMLQAQVVGNFGRLADLLRDVRVKSGSSLRLRVVSSLRESVAHRAMGDASRERECLEFVIENGNAMPAVSAARQRLAELDA